MLGRNMGREDFSSSEWRDRCHVSLLCRLLALHRMSDAANQNVAVRCSDGFDAIGRHLGISGDAARFRAAKDSMPLGRSGHHV